MIKKYIAVTLSGKSIRCLWSWVWRVYKCNVFKFSLIWRELQKWRFEWCNIYNFLVLITMTPSAVPSFRQPSTRESSCPVCLGSSSSSRVTLTWPGQREEAWELVLQLLSYPTRMLCALGWAGYLVTLWNPNPLSHISIGNQTILNQVKKMN